MEMSKKLTISILALYVFSVLLNYVVYSIWHTDLTFILEYVQTSFNVILTGYFLKSGAENLTKILNTNKVERP